VIESARPATRDDLAQVAALAEKARAQLMAGRGGAVFLAREARGDAVEADLAEALQDAAQRVLVGTLDDVVVGFATARTEGLRDGTVLGVIGDLFVEDEARGVGVGEALMEALLAWCSERGCGAVDAVALPGDRATKNFFEGSGFTARLLVMHHRMGS
jgi:GNAT superfamily N-acetyltransferase